MGASPELLDRAAGVLVGCAAGDALGAPYEFGTPPDGEARMTGGGIAGWAPGEWTDDTQMTLCVAEVAATGSLDAIAVGRRFLEWFASGPADVGIQTRAVLTAAAGDPAGLAAAAADHFARNPTRSAGNGSLMRTGPVALAHLGDDDAIADAARAVSALTHTDPLATEACVLWCVAIDRAVREDRLDGWRDGLTRVAPAMRERLAAAVDEATRRPPPAFRPNGFVLTALQAAIAAVAQTPVPEDDPVHLQHALHAAVRAGDDTDTVAAIAGALLGARWGASAVPPGWRNAIHGWPGYRCDDLVRLGALAVTGGRKGGAA